MMAASSKPPPSFTEYLRTPNAENVPPSSTRLQTPSTSSDDYRIPTKSYQQQFNDMYFLRLAVLKPILSEIARSEWSSFVLGSNRAHSVPRVLDVRQGEVCWVIGTIYLDMPLKPNILDDISKDHFLLPPPPREKYRDTGLDQIMLEDESGRLRLTGTNLEGEELVTGVVVAVLGSENSEGEFQVLDIRYPDLPPMAKVKTDKSDSRGKVVATSGLGIYGALQERLELHLFTEWLLGEAGGDEDQAEAATISRLIIAGNSLGTSSIPLNELNTEETKKLRTKKYGYDAKAYNPAPTSHFDALLSSLLPSIPITLLPGATDPANISFPQQPLHPALFPTAKAYDNTMLTRATNPWSGTVGNYSFLVTSGQNLDDVFKYVEGDSLEERLDMCERMLRWRIVAPTAPDTLWAYPMRERDPFVIEETPDWFIVGNQQEFGVRTVKTGDGERKCTIVLVPRFEVSGEVVVLDLEKGEVEGMIFGAKVEGI